MAQVERDAIPEVDREHRPPEVLVGRRVDVHPDERGDGGGEQDGRPAGLRAKELPQRGLDAARPGGPCRKTAEPYCSWCSSLLKPILRWLLSQNGLFPEAPHRQRAARVTSRTVFPSPSTSRSRPARRAVRLAAGRSSSPSGSSWTAVEPAEPKRARGARHDRGGDAIGVGSVDPHPRTSIAVEDLAEARTQFPVWMHKRGSHATSIESLAYVRVGSCPRVGSAAPIWPAPRIVSEPSPTRA